MGTGMWTGMGTKMGTGMGTGMEMGTGMGVAPDTEVTPPGMGTGLRVAPDTWVPPQGHGDSAVPKCHPRCPQSGGGGGGTQPQHRLLPGFPSNRCRAPARLRAEHYGMEVGWRGGGGGVSTPQCPPPLFGVPPLWGPTTTRGSPTQTHICGLPAWIRLGPTTILGSPIRGRFLGSPNLSPLWVPPTILGPPFVGFLLHFGVPPLF